jgi:hypothetical protein
VLSFPRFSLFLNLFSPIFLNILSVLSSQRFSLFLLFC